MMNRMKPLMLLLSAVALVASVTACQKREATADQKGPAETAGKQIDRAAVKAGEQLNKVAEEAGKGLAKAGEKLQNAAQDAQKKE
jgi:uncharacterized lipoprotein YehR (DUF1307 family)